MSSEVAPLGLIIGLETRARVYFVLLGVTNSVESLVVIFRTLKKFLIRIVNIEFLRRSEIKASTVLVSRLLMLILRLK